MLAYISNTVAIVAAVNQGRSYGGERVLGGSVPPKVMGGVAHLFFIVE